MGYVLPVIRSFKGKFAEAILQGRMVPKGFPANLAKVARRKLIMVDSADLLEALSSPPGPRRPGGGRPVTRSATRRARSAEVPSTVSQHTAARVVIR